MLSSSVPSDSHTTQAKPTKSRRWRSLARMFLFSSVATLLAGWGLLGCFGSRLVAREVARTPRDPITGVVLGAEELTIPANPEKLRPGRAVLMLHGFLGSRGDFNDLGQRIAAEGFHVRMIREAGHGTSPADFAPLSPAQMQAHVREEFLALKKDYPQVDVVGFSMGGTLATLLAAEQPVNRLVLCAPYYEVAYRWYYGLRAENWNRAIGWSLSYVPKTPLFIKCNKREVRDQIYCYSNVPLKGVNTLFTLGAAARAPEVLQSITCPVAVLISQGDEASCPQAAARAFAQLGSQDKHFIEVPLRNNHMIFWDHDADQSKAQVINFLTTS